MYLERFSTAMIVHMTELSENKMTNKDNFKSNGTMLPKCFMCNNWKQHRYTAYYVPHSFQALASYFHINFMK